MMKLNEKQKNALKCLNKLAMNTNQDTSIYTIAEVQKYHFLIMKGGNRYRLHN